MKTLLPGTKVKITTGKHKGKSAVVKQSNAIHACCLVNDFYLWFFPDSVEEWGANGDCAEANRWNPDHFGNTPRKCEPNGQMTIWFDCDEPPDPDDCQSLEEYEAAWQEWKLRQLAT